MLEIGHSDTFFIEKNPEWKNIKYCVEYVVNNLEIASSVLLMNWLKRKTGALEG
jgi:hypothetical protein